MIKITKDTPTYFNFRAVYKEPVVFHAAQMDEPFEVETPEGIMTGKAGDYLMLGANNEYYPCAKEIFEKTYEFCIEE